MKKRPTAPQTRKDAPRDTARTTLRLIACLADQRLRLTLVCVAILGFCATTVYAPYLCARFIDALLAELRAEGPFAFAWDPLGRLLAWVAGAYALNAAFANAPLRLGPPRGSVIFSHVRFGYHPKRVLMDNVNLVVRPGQKVAIVGSTGAGKTTLVNLLMRFYDVNRGHILVDGTPISAVPRADLRRRFGMVLQDTWLFEGTVAENIAYARPDATRDEVVRAAKLARADHFIRALPQGYDTRLKTGAETLSVGQRQLLTIARVFLAAPPMLILDEATSSVDTRTEAEIAEAMRGLMRGRTAFVIAHRLSTIRDADLILYMERGDITEKGTHEELLRKGGAYAALYASQFA